MRFVVAILTLLSLGAAPAAAQWAPPQEIPGASSSSPAGLVFGRNGSALASWHGAGGAQGVDRIASRSPGGTWSAPCTGPGHTSTSVQVPPVAYGRDRAVLAVQDTRSATDSLSVAFGRTSSCRFGTLRRVVSSRRIVSARLAVNSRGRAALAWFEDRGTSNDRVWVSLRPAGGGFGRPQLVEQGTIRSVSVAVGESDDVLVACDARGVIRTRYRSARGQRFHSRQTIRSEAAYFARLSAAVARNGRAYVAWSAQFRSEGGDSGPVFQQAAVKPAGSSRFRAAQLLDRIEGVILDEGALRLGIADAGATAAWTGWDGSHWRVRQSTTGPGGVFGPAQTISAAGEDAVLGALAVHDDGAIGPAVAVWDSGTEAPASTVRAAFRPAQGAFGAPETVSRTGDARFGLVAFDPRGPAPVAIWAQRPAGDSSAWQLFVAARG